MLSVIILENGEAQSKRAATFFSQLGSTDLHVICTKSYGDKLRDALDQAIQSSKHQKILFIDSRIKLDIETGTPKGDGTLWADKNCVKSYIKASAKAPLEEADIVDCDIPF